VNAPARIGILTGGGDCPGLNGVIRAVTRAAQSGFGASVYGIEYGFEGLVEGRMHELTHQDVSGILCLGGTILGTSSKGDPWHYPVEAGPGRIEIQDVSYKALRNLQQWGLDGLIAVGGDGTMHLAHRLMQLGVNIVGVPKTIDNDVPGTDVTFGFDTAVSVVSEAIDRLATTASSHHRVMVVEVMGRYAGWIALLGGVAGGADVILIPEIDFDWPAVLRKVNERQTLGKRFTIVCVAEGARLPDEGEVVSALDPRRTDPRRLGGVGARVAQAIEVATGHETRVTVLGHLQRGGTPTAADRVLATGFGAAAARCAGEGVYGVMVAMRGGRIVPVPLAQAIEGLRTVPPDHHLVMAARAVGSSFGDEGAPD
jgi:phosphofructokinase-like protein